MDISDAILTEILRVLRDKFQWGTQELWDLEEDIRSYTSHVSPGHELNVISADSADNRILECAVAARSEFIVSGDTRHLLPLGRYAGISILKVANFLEWLDWAP